MNTQKPILRKTNNLNTGIFISLPIIFCGGGAIGLFAAGEIGTFIGGIVVLVIGILLVRLILSFRAEYLLYSDRIVKQRKGKNRKPEVYKYEDLYKVKFIYAAIQPKKFNLVYYKGPSSLDWIMRAMPLSKGQARRIFNIFNELQTVPIEFAEQGRRFVYPISREKGVALLHKYCKS